MAARTSSSLGVGILVTLLGIATLGLFVTTVIMWSTASSERRRADEQETRTAAFIREDERSRDVVVRYRDAATKAKKSLVTYLIDSQGDAMARVTGSRTDTVEDIGRKFGETDSPNLLALVRNYKSQVDSLTARATAAEDARNRALQDKENEARRVKALEDAQKATLAALNAELDKYKGEVDTLRASIDEYKTDKDNQLQAARDEFVAERTSLTGQLDKQQQESVLNQGRIRQLEQDLKGRRLTGQSEYALVDARIIGMNAADGTAVIDIGRKNKLILGQTFAVYNEPTAIRPDAASGEYPEGKASVEVIGMTEDTATVRILSQKRGNPIVRGDVLANAIYDPNKTYVFVIYGNFDSNRDGRATIQEQADTRATIVSWGGKVIDDLSGEADFLVLGERPVLPPEPPSTAPSEIVEEWLRLRRLQQRYDELFRRAGETSIPILNENRLKTLIGDRF